MKNKITKIAIIFVLSLYVQACSQGVPSPTETLAIPTESANVVPTDASVSESPTALLAPTETANVVQPEATEAIPTVISVDTPVPLPSATPPLNTPQPLPDLCPPDISKWFFTFTVPEPTTACPSSVQTTDAIGQDFEGGRVYYYAASPHESDQRGTVYVIYNNGYWETRVNIWDPSQPASDPSLVPPEGRYQPIEIIGKMWRDNSDVRAELGWAYEPQSAFTGRVQRYNSRIGHPPENYPHFYIDHGKSGVVLRLYLVDMGPNTWEVVGSYE